MDSTGDTKPHVCFQFEVEKIIDMSVNGSYQVQWRPAWVSKFHLVGCEHLIQEFLLQQQLGMEIKPHPFIQPQETPSRVINEMNSSGVYELPHLSSTLEIKIEPDIELELPYEGNETKDSRHLIEDIVKVQSENNSCESDQFNPELYHKTNASYESTQVLELDNCLIKREKLNGKGTSSSSCTKTSTSISSNLNTSSCQDSCATYSHETETLGLEQDQIVAEVQEQVLPRNSTKMKRHELWTTIVKKEIPIASSDRANKVETAMHTMKMVAQRCELIFKEKIQVNARSGEMNDEEYLTEEFVLEESCASRKKSKLDHNEPRCAKEKQCYKNKHYTCKICQQTFSFHIDFTAHMKTHPPEVFLCPHCPEKFSRKDYLNCHLRFHMKGNKFTCYWCDFSCFHEDDLAAHLCQHTLICDTCNRSFACKSELDYHLRTRHRPEKQFNCNVCGKSFDVKQKMQQHLKLHAHKRLYACMLCDSKFTRNDRLKQHMNVHSGEKPFRCSYCSLTFTNRYFLKKHLGTHEAN